VDLCDFFCVPGLNYVNSCSPEGMPAGAMADDTAGVDVRSGSFPISQWRSAMAALCHKRTRRLISWLLIFCVDRAMRLEER
jgi:hypothetical protein